MFDIPHVILSYGGRTQYILYTVDISNARCTG